MTLRWKHLWTALRVPGSPFAVCQVTRSVLGSIRGHTWLVQFQSTVSLDKAPGASGSDNGGSLLMGH